MKINTVRVWGQTAPLFKNVLQYNIPFKSTITLTLKIITIPFKYCKTFLKGVFCYLNFVFAWHIHITVNFNYRVQLYVISDFFIRKKFSNKFSKGWMLNHLYLNFENLNNDILNTIDMLEGWNSKLLFGLVKLGKLPYMCIFWFTFSYSIILHHTWISVNSWWLNAVIIICDLKS